MGLEDISSIQWPAEGGVYKVVQMELQDRPLLLVAHSCGDEDYHIDILERFLKKQELSFKRVPLRFGMQGPDKKGKQYTAVGMGLMEYDPQAQLASFYGDSTAYGLGINKEHLEKLRQMHTGWTLDALF